MNILFFFFKQKTAYEMRISDWSSDVCSSDLPSRRALAPQMKQPATNSSAVTATYAGHGSHSSMRKKTMPTKVPKVPGARGARPAPNPNARTCSGVDQIRSAGGFGNAADLPCSKSEERRVGKEWGRTCEIRGV